MESKNNIIKPEILSGDDNARKFVTSKIDTSFLRDWKAESFIIITDWIITGQASEKKLVHKILNNGESKYMYISKTTIGVDRKTEKKAIFKREYMELSHLSKVHSKKTRSEFRFYQGNTCFDGKYDELFDGKLLMLEVDAANELERNKFRPGAFPYNLMEVTGDQRYYGYRIAAWRRT